MSLRRRILLLGLVVFVGFIVAHSVLPWHSTVALITPTGVKSRTASFRCGALWSGGYVHGPAHTPYPLAGTPCARRVTYQVLTFLDVILGAAAFVVVLVWGRAHRIAATA